VKSGTGGSPIILAIQEAEIRRIKVSRQSQAKSSQNCVSKIPNTKKWLAPSKSEALSSNSVLSKKGKRKWSEYYGTTSCTCMKIEKQ
jgi:hypothetical protein